MSFPALSLLLALAAPAQEPSAGPLISKMFGRYSTANSLRGNIKMTQTAESKSVVVQTDVQYAKPSKLYIKQQRTGTDPRSWLVVSDGKHLAYDRPEGVLGLKDRFVDPVTSPRPEGGGFTTMDVKDMYLAVSRSLGDKPAPLDIVFGRNDDLRVLIALWGKMTISGKAKVRDKEVNVVHGGFRESFNGPLVGDMEMLITDDGDLYRIRTLQVVTVPGAAKPVSVETTFECDLAVNGQPVEALFSVVK